MKNRKILSKQEAIQLMWEIVSGKKGDLSKQIKHENNKIARIVTRPTTDIHFL